VVLVAVAERWFDWIWCEEFRCRRDAALAERVSTPDRLSDHEAARNLRMGFRWMRSANSGRSMGVA
jgi:hypothetical protein